MQVSRILKIADTDRVVDTNVGSHIIGDRTGIKLDNLAC